MTIFERTVVLFDIKPRRATVVEVIRGTAFTRVMLAGPELDEIRTGGPEDHVRLVLPGEDGSAPQFRKDEASGRLRPLSPARDMTIRYFDDDGHLAIDIVHHPDGPLIDWVRRVEPGGWGCEVALMGPRASLEIPDAEHYILGADGSALPALNRWLELLPASANVDVIVDESAASGLSDYVVDSQIRSMNVIDAERDGEYVRTLQDLAPSSEHYVWLAGEASTLIPARRWLRSDESEVLRDNLKVQGYWKHGVAGRDHHAPLDPEEGE